MSEFGGIYFTPDTTLPNTTETQENEWILDEADAQLQSWTFWASDRHSNPRAAIQGGAPESACVPVGRS